MNYLTALQGTIFWINTLKLVFSSNEHISNCKISVDLKPVTNERDLLPITSYSLFSAYWSRKKVSVKSSNELFGQIIFFVFRMPVTCFVNTSNLLGIAMKMKNSFDSIHSLIILWCAEFSLSLSKSHCVLD